MYKYQLNGHKQQWPEPNSQSHTNNNEHYKVKGIVKRMNLQTAHILYCIYTKCSDQTNEKYTGKKHIISLSQFLWYK